MIRTDKNRDFSLIAKMYELSANTTSLLLNVSRQLSGRSKYRYTQFWLTISDAEDCQTVQLVPSVEVFPNIHRRKNSDRILLTDKAAQGFLIDETPSNVYYTRCNPNTFVPGTYVFKQSINNKKRRWFKV